MPVAQRLHRPLAFFWLLSRPMAVVWRFSNSLPSQELILLFGKKNAAQISFGGAGTQNLLLDEWGLVTAAPMVTAPGELAI